jgi:hypothetical protein
MMKATSSSLVEFRRGGAGATLGSGLSSGRVEVIIADYYAKFSIV